MKILCLALLLFPMGMENVRDYGMKVHVVVGEVEGSGSGVLIGDDLILTANHLFIEGAKFYSDDDHSQELVVVKWSEEHDLLLLRSKTKHKGVALGKEPKVLDEVYAVGHPLGSNKIIVVGRVADQTDSKILIDATVMEGMSGGGVFDKKRKLIGIVVASWGKDTKFMVAIHLKAIREFIKTP